jgi:membrane AbrB-like protein
MVSLAIDPPTKIPWRTSRGQLVAAAQLTAVMVFCYFLSEAAEIIDLPAPQLLVSLAVGAVLALTGLFTSKLPKQITRPSHAMIGVLMGSYLDPATLGAAAGAALPLAGITALTIAISLAVAALMARSRRIALPDSALGMVPGGSAAIIACADDVGADARFVAFAQYIRVGLVALTAPLLVLAVDGVSADDDSPVSIGLPMVGHLVTADDQFARLLVLAGICLLGIQLGTRFSLPAAVLLGPMMLATVVLFTNTSNDFAPAGPLKDMIFVVVGLEVGLRFTRASVRHVGRVLPHIVGATLLVCLACAALALTVAPVIGMSFMEAYLATTPGGINAVLATAESTDTNVPVVSTVQSIRLFVVCLCVPPMIRWLTRRNQASLPPVPEPPSTQPSREPLRELEPSR